jgi:hypothetical protein
VLDTQVFEQRAGSAPRLSAMPIMPGQVQNDQPGLTRPPTVPEGHVPVWLHPSLAGDVMNFFSTDNAAIPHPKDVTPIVKAQDAVPAPTNRTSPGADFPIPVSGDASTSKPRVSPTPRGNPPVLPAPDLPPIDDSEPSLFEDNTDLFASPEVPPERIVPGPGRVGGQGPIIQIPRDRGNAGLNQGLTIIPTAGKTISPVYAGGGDIDFGGEPAGLQPGESTIEPTSTSTPGTVTSQGSADQGYGPAGVTDYTGPRSNDPNSHWVRDPNAPGGYREVAPQQAVDARLAGILQHFPSLNNPAAIRAINSGANPADLVGHAQFDSHAAGLMEMAYQSFGGTPNDMATTGDAGHTIYYPNGNVVGTLDPESGTIQPVAQQAAFVARDKRWVFPSQSESAKLGLTVDPQKMNDWLVAHNPWFYAASKGGG